MKTKILLVVVGVFLISGMVLAYTTTYECWCECSNGHVRLETGPGTIKGVGVISHANSGEECMGGCGAVCGNHANYPEDCESCSTYCSHFTNTDSQSRCRDACESKCELNGMTNDVVNIIYYIAGILAVMVFVINGYRLMTSITAEERDDAKRGIMYVVIALVIIAITGSLVKVLFSGLPALSEKVVTEVSPPSGECASGASAILSNDLCELSYIEFAHETGHHIYLQYDGEKYFERSGSKSFNPIEGYYLFWYDNGKGCEVSYDSTGKICLWQIYES